MVDIVIADTQIWLINEKYMLEDNRLSAYRLYIHLCVKCNKQVSIGINLYGKYS